MTVYAQLITEATGVSDPKKIAQVEAYMRHIYFHSTLDWQTKEEIVQAAKESVAELDDLHWTFR